VPTPPAAAAALAKDANVLVIMIDTLRADRLGVAGYRRDDASLTPSLDGLVAQGAWFTRAYAQAPNTPRSMPSFMTSRYPSVVAVDKLFKNYPRVADENLMLFEVLREAGLTTLGYASHFYFRDAQNFVQGFDLYDNEGALDIGPGNRDIAAPRIVPKVTAKLAELGQSRQRFAMWVHLFEPHSTYVEHEGRRITERGTASLVQKYDYEIAFTDEWVGRILAALDTSGLAGNTIVVIASDHGEAFGVHSFAGQKMFFHGQTLYDELLRVPLILRVPGAAPTRSDAVVELIDVAPTLLDALGLPIPPSFMGRSLVPALRGEALPPRPAFAELIPYPSWDHEGRAVMAGDGRWKLFDRVSDNRKELYDLVADPEERKDLYRASADRARELEDLLLDFQDRLKAQRPDAGGTP
jgi:arylsulfatase A-like enzyme